MERAAVAEQLAGQDGGVARGDDEIIGDPVLAGVGVGVASGLPGRRGGVRSCGRPAGSRSLGAASPSTGGQRSGSGSASQPSSSVPKISGRSSCGKWPVPSMTRQR